MRAIDVVRKLNGRYGELMVMAGVTLELVDGRIVIESESGARDVEVEGATDYGKVVGALIDVLHHQGEDYRGYRIQPKLDFGETAYLCNGVSYKHGWLVVRDGCNAMPGATWFKLRRQARHAIDILIEVNGDSNEFWSRMRARD